MGQFDRPIDFFPDVEAQAFFKNWSRKSERVELPILAARIDVGGEGADEIGVDVATQGRFIQIGVVDATDGRAET